MVYTGSVPDTAGRRHDWMARMACRDGDPDLFFDPEREHDARLVCVVRCPVREACLANVKEAESGARRADRHGVLAGLTDYERWRLDPEAPRGKEDAPTLRLDGTEQCGSYYALLRHLWLYERVDGVCWSGEVRRAHGNKERRIHTLWATGASDLDIARRMAVSVPSVRRVRDRLGLLPNLPARAAS